MIRFILSIFGSLLSTVTLGLAMGALTLGAIFYIYSRDLPSAQELASYTPKTISRIYSSEGQIVDEFALERRLFAPADEIPDLLKAAFISAEDKNFYEHPGYDARGMVSALIDAVRSGGQDLRGASTITQQVMKNFLLDGSRNIERKIKEIMLATRAEAILEKDGILELYMNEIFLGMNSYGVAAAAQSYFNKPLRDLRPEEAAYLAALPKGPSTYHPVRQKERATARRDFVLKEMLENGYLTKAAYDQAVATPLRTVQNGDFHSFGSSLPPRDYPTDEIRRQLSRDVGEAEFFTGGYSVRTTIDPQLQTEAAKSLRQGLESYDRGLGVWRGTGLSIPAADLGDDTWRDALAKLTVPRDITSYDGDWYPAVVLGFDDAGNARIGIEGVDDVDGGHWIPNKDAQWARRKDPATGKLDRKARTAKDLLRAGDVVHVRSMTSDANGGFIRWTLRQVPEVQGGFVAMDVRSGRVLAIQGGFSYQHSVFNRATQGLRQPGSSFKPFVYAAALDSGYSPATIVIDAPIEVNTPQGLWRPRNSSNKYYGPTPVRTGIEQSRNLMTIRLAEEVGMDLVAQYAEGFGVYEPGKMGRYLSASLGTEETSLYKMVAAYAMFANGGERVEPTLIDRVQDLKGRTIYRQDKRVCPECRAETLASGRLPKIVTNRERIMDAITAYQLTSMMEGVVTRGTARKTVNLSTAVAGKTGTTNEAKDVWFVGFTKNIVAGCYIGYDTPRPMGRGATGGGMCGPVFNRFMKEAVQKYGGGDFEVPPGGVFIKIDRLTGARLSDSASGDHVVSEYFRLGEEPGDGDLFEGALDGGFKMGADLDLYGQPEPGPAAKVTTSSGQSVTIAPKASFGSLSSGGLY